MTFIFLAALLALPHPRVAPPAPETAPPQAPLSDEELRQRIEAYLGSIDTRIPAARWKALGVRAADVLEPIVENESELPSRRAMAVSALVLVAPERAAPLVSRLAVDEKQPLPVRIESLHGVGRTSSPALAAQTASKVLRTAREPGVRGAAAEVMAGSGSSGCAQVKAQVAREAAELRPAYRRALARCKE
jgi:hypothetical protein